MTRDSRKTFFAIAGSAFESGKVAMIGVVEESQDIFLSALGMRPGKHMQDILRAPFDGSIQEIGDGLFMVSYTASCRPDVEIKQIIIEIAQ